MSDTLPGYDSWKTTPPDEPLSDDPDCTCTQRRRSPYCTIHGIDPDTARDDKTDRDLWDERFT